MRSGLTPHHPAPEDLLKSDSHSQDSTPTPPPQHTLERQEPRTQEVSSGPGPRGTRGTGGAEGPSDPGRGASSYRPRPRPSGIRFQGPKELQPSFCRNNKG